MARDLYTHVRNPVVGGDRLSGNAIITFAVQEDDFVALMCDRICADRLADALHANGYGKAAAPPETPA